MADAQAVSGFEIAVADFSGPFDLLLKLIYQRQFDLTELALLEVTQEFVEYVRRLDAKLYLPKTSEFLVVASTLLALKAQKIMPGATEEQNFDSDLLEAQNMLFASLIQYKVYQDVARELESSLAKRAFIFRARAQSERFVPRAVFPENFSKQNLAEVWEKLLVNNPSLELAFSTLPRDTVSVESAALKLAQRLVDSRSVKFSDLLRDSADSFAIVADFLAVLELFRHSLIELEQQGNFKEIQLVLAVQPEQLVGRVRVIFSDKLGSTDE
jgi:segregation and condensation protein A